MKSRTIHAVLYCRDVLKRIALRPILIQDAKPKIKRCTQRDDQLLMLERFPASSFRFTVLNERQFAIYTLNFLAEK